VKLASVEGIVRALNEAGVLFIVVGGLAVVAHGYGRLTQDLDLVVRLDRDNLRRAFDALATMGYQPRVPVTADGLADPRHRARWIDEKGMTVLNFHSDRHRETPVELFVTDDWSLATFDGLRRRQQAEFRLLPLREKIRILEEMQEIADAVARSVRRVV
jgi:hypothetical protein